MRTSDLLLSSLDITEDEYFYKGQFILTSPDRTRSVDIMELESDRGLAGLKSYFSLDDDCGEIRRTLMEMIMETADINSKVVEGD